MELDEKIKERIAVGASITAHCESCLEYHSMKALESGSDAEEIAEAIEVGKRVQFVSEQAKSPSGSRPACLLPFSAGLPHKPYQGKQSYQ